MKTMNIFGNYGDGLRFAFKIKAPSYRGLHFNFERDSLGSARFCETSSQIVEYEHIMRVVSARESNHNQSNVAFKSDVKGRL